VHQDQPGSRGGASLGQARIAQPADVIDDRGAGSQRSLGHLGLVGVDRDRDVQLRPQPLDDRHHALDLDRRLDRRAVGHPRLAPHVDHVGPRLHQLGRQRRLGGEGGLGRDGCRLPAPLVRRADGQVRQIDARGPLLGIIPDLQLADARFRLAAGDTLLLYTARDYPSGVSDPSALLAEARFGTDWLLKMWDAQQRVLYFQVGIGDGNNGSILGDHDLWRLPQADDRSSASPRSPRYFATHRPVFAANAPGRPISPYLAGRVAASPAVERLTVQLMLAIEEAATNVVSYAFAEVPPPHQDGWEAQRRRVCQAAADGAWWGTITSEPGSGGDVAQTRAVARPGSDGAYRLSGQKHFGSGSGITSYMLTSAVPAGEGDVGRVGTAGVDDPRALLEDRLFGAGQAELRPAGRDRPRVHLLDRHPVARGAGAVAVHVPRPGVGPGPRLDVLDHQSAGLGDQPLTRDALDVVPGVVGGGREVGVGVLVLGVADDAAVVLARAVVVAEVVGLEAEHRAAVKGIVHDQSASGQTVFIEPLEIMEANNALREAELAERLEVERILDELSRRIEKSSEELDAMTTALAALDLIIAKALYGDALQAARPELNASLRA